MADIEIEVTQLSVDLAVDGVDSVTAGTGLLGDGVPGGVIVGAGTIAVNFAPNGSGTSVQVPTATDARLSNARTPTTHKTTHEVGGSDELVIAQSQVTNLSTDLSGKVSTTRQIVAGTGLTGGGDLTVDRTLALDIAPDGAGSATQVPAATDTRLSNARTPTSHGGTHGVAGSDPIPAGSLDQSQVANLVSDLAAKVPTSRQVLAGLGLTGSGNLGSDVTLTCDFAASGVASVGKPVEATDSRLANSRSPNGAASGDLSGTYPSPTVAGIVGRPVDAAPPAANDVLVYSGSQWNHVAQNTLSVLASLTSYTAPPSGSVTRTVTSRLGDIISVKDFGAIGDGVSNDTAALQTALTASAGKALYFPPGTYRITAALSVPANTTLWCDPRKAVIDVQPANPPTPPGSNGPTTYNNGFEIAGDGVVFNGLWIKGSNEAKYRSTSLTQRDEYAAAIKSTNRQNLVVQNCMIEKFGNGVFFTGGNNYKIIDNFFFGGRQMGVANNIANTHDIWVNGSTGVSPNKGFRGIISRNHCLSNCDDHISVALEAGDTDVVVSENVCEPFQVDGVTPVTQFVPTLPLVGGNPDPLDPVLQDPACNKTRYSIVVSYGGGWPARINVSNNVVRNCSHNAIYANSETQSPVAAGSEVAITGNVVSNCGLGTLYPSAASLKGGIWVNTNGGKTITGNLVLDCGNAGIAMLGSSDDTANAFATPVVSGNTILRTALEPVNSNAGHGILVAGSTIHSVLLSSNRIYNSAGNSILADCQAATSGNIHIVGNLVSHNNTKGAIRVIVAAGGSDCFVTGNKITGTDNTTSNGGLNAGIWFSGRVHCTSNSITKFHRGIESQFSGRVTDVVCADNLIQSTNFGITGQADGPWLITGNVFNNISGNVCHAGPFQGIMLRASGVTSATKADIIEVTNTVAPTVGTWVVGDHVRNSTPAVGQDKGWFCTVAGTPGTWVSEGTL